MLAARSNCTYPKAFRFRISFIFKLSILLAFHAAQHVAEWIGSTSVLVKNAHRKDHIYVSRLPRNCSSFSTSLDVLTTRLLIPLETKITPQKALNLLLSPAAARRCILKAVSSNIQASQDSTALYFTDDSSSQLKFCSVSMLPWSWE